MKTKKQIKALKREIVTNSAVNIGFYNTIINALPIYATIEAVKNISVSGYININTPEAEATNILVTEAIKVTSYQDFKELVKYFFH
nr:hypothetical protein [uncultured Flavobacterium sp.]